MEGARAGFPTLGFLGSVDLNLTLEMGIIGSTWTVKCEKIGIFSGEIRQPTGWNDSS
jgi:hypothetical protein